MNYFEQRADFWNAGCCISLNQCLGISKKINLKFSDLTENLTVLYNKKIKTSLVAKNFILGKNWNVILSKNYPGEILYST